ncbi:MAG: hypothetical protein J6D37_03205 [Clostridia bacterium]|nr:hypothetical protein [Clostridia bacterium]
MIPLALFAGLILFLLFFPFVFECNAGLLASRNRFILSVKLWGFLRIFKGFFFLQKGKVYLSKKEGETEQLKKKGGRLQKAVKDATMPLQYRQILEIGSGSDLMPAMTALWLVDSALTLPPIREKIDKIPFGFIQNSVLLTDRTDLKVTSHAVLLLLPIVVIYRYFFGKRSNYV